MKFYRDEKNNPRAEAEGDLDILASFLECDIQGDKEAAIELFSYLEKKQGERTGTIYRATFDDKQVGLHVRLDDNETGSYNRNVFFQAVEAWIVFISD